MTRPDRTYDIRPITSQLSALRRGMFSWVLVDTACRLLWTSALLSLASLLIDWWLRLDRPQRGVLLLLGLAVPAVVLWRRLVRPLMHRVDDQTLCMQVERKFPQLGEAVVTALNLARHPDPVAAGYSPKLVEHTVDQGVRASETVRFVSVLDQVRWRRNLALIAGWLFIVGLSVFLAVRSEQVGRVARIWFARNVLLSDTVMWPEKTRLYIEGATIRNGVLVMTEGEDLTVFVTAQGKIPSTVRLWFADDRGESGNVNMANKAGQFVHTFKNVISPMRLRLSGGDTRTIRYVTRIDELEIEQGVRELQVRLTPRPELVPGSLQVTQQLPAYTAIGNDSQPASVRLDMRLPVHGVLAGSALKIHGQSTKDLKQIRFRLAGRNRPTLIVDGAGRRAFDLHIDPAHLRDGTWQIELLDIENKLNKPAIPLKIKLVPDQAPVVKTELLGIGDRILKTAVIPMQSRITDDYGIKQAAMVVVAEQQQTRRLRKPINPLVLAAAVNAGSRRELVLPSRLDLKVEDLSVDVGSVVTFYITASDQKNIPTSFDKLSPMTPGTTPATSPTTAPATRRSVDYANWSHPQSRSLRVVSVDDFLQYLTSREQQLAVEFDGVINTQQTLQLDTQVVQESGAGHQQLDTTQWWPMLNSTEKQQRQVIERCRSVAKAYRLMLAEVRNNRLPDAESYQRLMPAIIKPLDRLTETGGLLDAAVDRLNEARRASGDPQARQVALADALAQQERALALMKKIRKAMTSLGEFQQAINYLRRIARELNMNEQQLKAYIRRVEKQVLENMDLFD